MLSAVFGLFAAISWGAGDYFGGLASRKIGEQLAVFLSQAGGSLLLVAALLVVREPFFSTHDLLFSLCAGVLGAFGLLLFYRSLVVGPLSIAAPVSALLGALIPILVGSFTEGLPGPLQLIAFVIALAAVWLIARGDATEPLRLSHLRELGLPLLAGLFFGLFFVLIHQASRHAILWPMLVGRLGGTVVLSIVLLLRRIPLKAPGGSWGLIALMTVLDLGGNLGYILAGQFGRLDVAAVLGSLYPGVTVFLAWLVLKERIGRAQSAGIAAALVAIVLLAL